MIIGTGSVQETCLQHPELLSMILVGIDNDAAWALRSVNRSFHHEARRFVFNNADEKDISKIVQFKGQRLNDYSGHVFTLVIHGELDPGTLETLAALNANGSTLAIPKLHSLTFVGIQEFDQQHRFLFGQCPSLQSVNFHIKSAPYRVTGLIGALVHFTEVASTAQLSIQMQLEDEDDLGRILAWASETQTWPEFSFCYGPECEGWPYEDVTALLQQYPAAAQSIKSLQIEADDRHGDQYFDASDIDLLNWVAPNLQNFSYTLLHNSFGETVATPLLLVLRQCHNMRRLEIDIANESSDMINNRWLRDLVAQMPLLDNLSLSYCSHGNIVFTNEALRSLRRCRLSFLSLFDHDGGEPSSVGFEFDRIGPANEDSWFPQLRYIYVDDELVHPPLTPQVRHHMPLLSRNEM